MRFTKEHEWVKLDGEIATVGITDYAQHALGDVVSVELPKLGTKVKQSASFALVDSMKASSDVYAPMSGEVIQVNNDLAGSPQLINESPEEKGWLAKIKVENPGEMDKLMTREQYDEFIKGIQH